MCSKKLLKKLLASPFLVMLQAFFIQRVLKGKLGTQKVPQGTLRSLKRALRHSGTRRIFRHSGTQDTWILWHSSTWGAWALKGHLGGRALKGHLDTQALRHLGTRSTRGTLYSGFMIILHYLTTTGADNFFKEDTMVLDKVWMRLYTCPSNSRGILVLVPRSHSWSFIASFPSFISSQFCPSYAISNNWGNFVSKKQKIETGPS